jgi:hypothetical protein
VAVFVSYWRKIDLVGQFCEISATVREVG